MFLWNSPACRARAESTPQWYQPGWLFRQPEKCECLSAGSEQQAHASPPLWPVLWPRHGETQRGKMLTQLKTREKPVQIITGLISEGKQQRLQTCLLNCMMPRVGKTQALAGGMISESAKLTHCSTWALVWGVLPRRASLLTTRETGVKRQPSKHRPQQCFWTLFTGSNVMHTLSKWKL